MNTFKKLGAIFLVIALLITTIPLYAFADISNSKSAKWQEGRKLVSADGDYYTFKYEGFMQIWQYDTKGGEKYKGWTREFKEPRRIFSLTQGDDSVRGYCLEHGIIAEGGVKYSAESISSNKVFNSLSDSQRNNIILALLYGYGSSGSLKSMGYSSSHEYNNDDWYMATQILVWEIEQGFRKSNLDRADSVSLHYGKGTSYSDVKTADNVSIYHYYRVIKDTPAEGIYNWMIKAMKSHKSIPEKLSGTSSKPEVVKLKQQKDSKGNATNVWKGTISSSNGKKLFISAGKNKAKLEIKYNSSSKKYELTWTGKNATDGPDSSVKYTVRNYVAGRVTPDSIKDNMRVWVHKISDTLHRQYLVAGYMDQYKWYISLKGVGVDVVQEEPDEPEYLPQVEIPVSKIDANPGWDNDSSTPMGDAGLDAEYILTDESGTEIDRIRLDENGTVSSIVFSPFKLKDLKAEKTGERNHKDGDHSCTISPTKIKWTASKTYTLKEIPPEGRCIGPDSGERNFTVKYEAVTDNSQKCKLNGTSWSDIKYTVSCGDMKISGTEDDIDSSLVLNKNDFTFKNDCIKGSMDLEKLLEDGTEEIVSTESQWKVYLQNSSKDGRYIRFAEEESLNDGTRVYRCTNDSSGKSCEAESLQVGSNGRLKLLDIPYGQYYVEEVKADTDSYITEMFELNVTEGSETYSYRIVDKKAKASVTLIKVDEETGKQVRLPGTKVRIKDKATGEYVIESGELDSNGELELPELLENGTYIIEEYELPEGYYARDGKCSIYEFVVKESGKHMAGEPYEYGEMTVKLDNSRAKGKIQINKTDENGKGIKGVVFEIYSAVDNLIHDAAGSLEMRSTETGDRIDSKLVKSTDSDNRIEEIVDILGNTIESDIYDTGIYDSDSGAAMWYLTERSRRADNRDMLIYTTPEEKDTSYSYSYENNGRTYDIDVTLRNTGSSAVSDVTITESGNAGTGTSPDISLDGKLADGGTFKEDGISFDMERSIRDSLTRCVDKSSSYEILEGWELSDEEESQYIIITDGERFKVLLDDLTWQECSEDGNLDSAESTEYSFRVISDFDCVKNLCFSIDGFKYTCKGGKVELDVKKSAVEPAISNGSGFVYDDGSFIAVPENIPYYFTAPEGEKISLGYSGGKIHVMVEADKDMKHLPAVEISKEKEGETDSMNLDLYTGNEIDITERFPGSKADCSCVEGRYCIDIVTSDEIKVTLGNGYVLSFYCSKSKAGNGIGVMESLGTWFTSGAIAGELVDVITTDEEGKAESRLLNLGSYIIRELTGVNGYIANPYGYEVNLESKGQEVAVVAENADIENEKAYSEIEILKAFETKGGSGVYEPSEGAGFGIFDEQGNCIEKVQTNDDGRAILKEKLSDGFYYIQETETKDNYSLDNMKYWFEVKDEITEKSNTFSIPDEGLSGEIFMDESGKVKLILNITHSLNMPDIYVDGCKAKANEEKGDRSVYELVCTDNMKVKAGEHNINIAVSSNTFSWSLDGCKKEVKPEAASEIWSSYWKKEVSAGDTVSFDEKEILIKEDGAYISDGSVLLEGESEDGICFGKGVLEISERSDSGESFKVLLNGRDASETVKLSKCITFERQSDKASCNMIKINTEDGINSGEIRNYIIPGILEITKEDMETGETLPGAEFEIYDDQDGRPGQIIYEGTTGTDGKLKVEEYAGTYWYHETKAPSGYVVDGEYYRVDIEDNSITEVAMDNERTKGVLEITKEDMETGETLPGAEFEIYSDDNGKPGEAIFEGETGDDGRLTVEETWGTYWYHETKAPSGYLVDGEYYRIDIKNNEITKVTMVNERASGVLEITKKDMETGDTLSGADFVIYDDNDGEPGSEVFRGTTGDDGKLIITEKTGTYWYHETKAPSGYIVDGQYYRVDIVDGEITKVTMVNERQKAIVAETGIDFPIEYVITAIMALILLAAALLLRRRLR